MEHESELREFTICSLREFGLTINDSQAEQFMCYLSHLLEWNKATNLTSIIDPKEVIIKHFLDSLTGLIATGFPEQAVVIDVGSGGGFPGVPLKIVRADMRVVLIEPTRKKCSFLNSLIGLLTLPDICAFSGTIEQYAKQPVYHSVDMVVVRALKFQELRKYIYPLLAPNGKVVLYRAGPIANQEVGDEFQLVSESDFALPQGSGGRVISVLEKIKL